MTLRNPPVPIKCSLGGQFGGHWLLWGYWGVSTGFCGSVYVLKV